MGGKALGVITGEKAAESSLWILPRRWAKQCLKPTISKCCWCTECWVGVWGRRYRKTVEKRNKWQDCCFLNWSSDACWQVFFPALLLIYQGDLSLFSQVCLIPRKQIGVTREQCELFPAPWAWLPRPSCFLLRCGKIDPPSLHPELIHQGHDAVKWPRTSWFVVPVLHLLVGGFLSLLPPQIPPAMLAIPPTRSLPWHRARSQLAHRCSAPTRAWQNHRYHSV